MGYKHVMCVSQKCSKKILSTKICVEIVLKFFKENKSVLLLLLKRKCEILKKIYYLLYA